MVTGFESFRAHFQGYEDCYTIIGGTACDILMSEAALPFRATRDIDMILLIENRFEEFAPIFWSYIKAGVTNADGAIQKCPIFTVLQNRNFQTTQK